MTNSITATRTEARSLLSRSVHVTRIAGARETREFRGTVLAAIDYPTAELTVHAFGVEIRDASRGMIFRIYA